MEHIPFTRQLLTGQLVITPSAMRRLTRGDVLSALRRHTRGDSGDFADPHRNPRKRVVLEGCRRLSAYRAENGTRFLVITEADASLTTLMLPEEC
jgi:hypothetical protein